jgi:hypothetical protein
MLALKPACPWLLALLIYCIGGLFLFPYPEEVRRAVEGLAPQEATLPYWYSGETKIPERLTFNLVLPPLHATRYKMWGDDCIESVRVNGTLLTGLPYCDWGKSLELDLASQLRAGLNKIEVTTSNKGGPGGLSFVVHPEDSLLLGYRLMLLLLVGAVVVVWCRELRLASFPTSALLGSVWIRIIYFWLTPARVRAYDLDGHIEYLKYVGEHYALPRSALGWEFHQPPLYYAVGAAVAQVVRWFSPLFQAELDALQLLSLLLSLGTLICGAASIWRLVRGEGERIGALLLLGFLPGLIFSAARISNDTFYHFCAFLWFLLALVWWQKPSHAKAFAACIPLACAVLAKLSALPLVVAAVLLFVLKRGLSIVSRVRLVLGSALLIGLGVSWYFYLRLSAGDSFAGSEKLASLHGGLRLETAWSSFLVFSPQDIFLTPFNRPFEEVSRRGYFFEYLFKSAFFGEFAFLEIQTWVVKLLLVSGGLFLVFSALGLLRILLLRAYDYIPVVLVGGALLASLILLRLQFPFSPHQDFRFIHLIAVPLCACASYAASSSRGALRVYLCVSVVLALSSIALVLSLSGVPGPV